jgi:hypothetical protein
VLLGAQGLPLAHSVSRSAGLLLPLPLLLPLRLLLPLPLLVPLPPPLLSLLLQQAVIGRVCCAAEACVCQQSAGSQGSTPSCQHIVNALLPACLHVQPQPRLTTICTATLLPPGFCLCLCRRMGVLRTLRLGLWQSAPVALLVPCASLFAGLLLPSQAVMFLAMGLKAITATNAFTGSLILVNAAAPKQSLGAVNGAGQSLASLVRALGPALGGLSWGWSSLLVGQDWWPHWVPHQYLPFVAAALVALVTDGVYWGLRLPAGS